MPSDRDVRPRLSTERFLCLLVRETLREMDRPATSREIAEAAGWSNNNSVRFILSDLARAGIVVPQGTYPQTFMLADTE